MNDLNHYYSLKEEFCFDNHIVGFEHVQDCTFGVQPLWSSGHFSSIVWSDIAREEGIQENRISWGSAVRKVEIYYRTTDL